MHLWRKPFRGAVEGLSAVGLRLCWGVHEGDSVFLFPFKSIFLNNEKKVFARKLYNDQGIISFYLTVDRTLPMITTSS